MSRPLHPDWWYPVALERAGDLAGEIGLCSLATHILPAPITGYVLDREADVVLFRLVFADVAQVEQISAEPDIYEFIVSAEHRRSAETWLNEHCPDDWSYLEYTSMTFESDADKARFEAALQANVSTLQDGAMVL